MSAKASGDFEHTIGVEGIFSVRLRNGDIHLRAVDGETVRVRGANGNEPLDPSGIIQGEGSLALDLRRRGRSSRLEVDVPRRASVVVESVSAEVDVDGLVGDQRYQTTSGEVTLRDVSGRIAVDAISGDVDIRATEDTAFTLRTVSGDIDLRAASVTTLSATTTSGDIGVAGRLIGPGPFGIETVSGDALFAVAGDVRIETATVSGDLRSEVGGVSDGGRGRRSLTIGSDGPLFTFRSMSGDLRVVHARPVEGSSATRTPSRTVASDPADPPVVADAGHAADTARAADLTGAPDPLDAASSNLRLDVLQALERGEIDVVEAARRFAVIDGEVGADPNTETVRSATPEASDA